MASATKTGTKSSEPSSLKMEVLEKAWNSTSHTSDDSVLRQVVSTLAPDLLRLLGYPNEAERMTLYAAHRREPVRVDEACGAAEGAVDHAVSNLPAEKRLDDAPFPLEVALLHELRDGLFGVSLGDPHGWRPLAEMAVRYAEDVLHEAEGRARQARRVVEGWAALSSVNPESVDD